ncbi:PilW family protein [Marinobacterium sp. YM272]|uniref:PilW family protein n=1 Tax=Marinobacterium sp. YM272 TaxID=3421654 RepID=UPI003D7F3D8F
MLRMKKQSGFSLIELMIALLLGLIVTGIAISMYVSTLGITRQTVTTMRLNQELRTTMDMMVRDIRRSGYWAAASLAGSPYEDAVAGGLPVNLFDDFTATAPTTASAATCVVLAYDYDGLGASDINKLIGYRLKDDAVEVLWKTSVITSGADCTGVSNWQNLTDENSTVITGLVFEPLPSAASFASAAARSIKITLTGQSATDARLVKQLVEEVRVRNDL